MSLVKDDVKKAVRIYSYVVGKMYHVRLHHKETLK